MKKFKDLIELTKPKNLAKLKDKKADKSYRSGDKDIDPIFDYFSSLLDSNILRLT